MAENTLDQVQRLVAQLSPHEQAHLLASLALRMAQAVTAGSTLITLDNEHLTRLVNLMTVCTPAVALAALIPPPQPAA